MDGVIGVHLEQQQQTLASRCYSEVEPRRSDVSKAGCLRGPLSLEQCLVDTAPAPPPLAHVTLPRSRASRLVHTFEIVWFVTAPSCSQTSCREGLLPANPTSEVTSAATLIWCCFVHCNMAVVRKWLPAAWRVHQARALVEVLTIMSWHRGRQHKLHPRRWRHGLRSLDSPDICAYDACAQEVGGTEIPNRCCDRIAMAHHSDRGLRVLPERTSQPFCSSIGYFRVHANVLGQLCLRAVLPVELGRWI
mmetsp:Transcript_122418/g.305582  ORF Transcript_122418/g.305582 Transcript_122418/m.305582 type:complete len:248 (-) Transcript_122418:216-959(-)